LEDDTEKDKAMEEATSIRFGHQLRAVFATILMYCRPANPVAFWMNSTDLSSDIENEALMRIWNYQEIFSCRVPD